MTKFKLLVFPSGRCILTTEGTFPPDRAEDILRAWELWKGGDHHDLLVLPETEVVQSVDIVLDIDES